MRSLLAALIAGLVLSLAAVFAVQWTAVQATLDGLMQDYIAAELAQDAEELFSSLVETPGTGPTLSLAHFDPGFIAPASGRYYQIVVGGTIALRSPSLVYDTLPILHPPAGGRERARARGPANQALLVTAAGYDFKGRPVTVEVAADLRPLDLLFAKLLARYTQVSLAIFALLVVLQIVIVRLVMSPLRRIRSDVALLERGEIATLGETAPSEVLPLVREVNRLLALLTQRLQRSRDALGNLAHALKGPLTVLSTRIASDTRIGTHPPLRDELLGELAVIGQRIDSELRRARVAGDRAGTAPIDLASEITALIATMRKLHADRQLEIACTVEPGLQFRGDREDFVELAGNLLDNACKWARSRVLVTVTGDTGLALRVEDDGPGCPPEALQQLASRGVRLDESTAGHGLGLAIAREIVAGYGGSLALGRSETLGGFAAAALFGPRAVTD